MLTKLRIRNFKNWADTSDIRLAPITVLFGSNSTGKSSLIQFLLMLRQTAESPDRRRVLHPGDQNTPVELGTFRDLVFAHDLTKEISFTLEWKLPATLSISDPIGKREFSGESLSFQASIAFDQKDQAPRVTCLQYDLANSQEPLRVSMKPTGAQNATKQQFEIDADPYKLVRNPGRAWKLPAPVRFYGFPEEVSAYYQNASFTSDLALSLEQELRRIQYLGPLRTVPKRSYIWSGEVPDHVGWAGERAVEALLAATDRQISPGYKKKSHPFQALIARWLKQMGLLDSFKVRPIAVNRKEYEVLVRTRPAGTDVTLPDVGFGVSQVLPVIVQCFYAQPHTTVLLEQPEIHLHPSVQMTLADLFIEAVQSREGGKDRAIQLIVESHSEHFLRRLQRRVAEQAIDPEQVALYFCGRGADGAILEPLKVNLFGDIENWPDDFFGDEMGEVSARMTAAAKRQEQAK
jgi:predicted ATPase